MAWTTEVCADATMPPLHPTADLIRGHAVEAPPPSPPPVVKGLTIDRAVEITAELETEAGLSYNPKSLLGLVLAMFLMVTLVMIARILYVICASAAKKRRGGKPCWVRTCELFFGNCETCVFHSNVTPGRSKKIFVFLYTVQDFCPHFLTYCTVNININHRPGPTLTVHYST